MNFLDVTGSNCLLYTGPPPAQVAYSYNPVWMASSHYLSPTMVRNPLILSRDESAMAQNTC
eukprot:scaffold24333_cov80-Skeletonema_marinoi.AAC.3